MSERITFAVVLLVVIAVSYGAVWLSSCRPELLSGFKWGDTEEQRERDREWLNLLRRSLNTANLITLIGGFVCICLMWDFIFVLFLVLPLAVAVMYAYSRRRLERISASKVVACIVGIVVLVLVLSPIAYMGGRDLKMAISPDGLHVSGMYGTTIPYDDIELLSLEQQAPESRLRTNGFSLGGTNIGHFLTKDDERVVLFLHSRGCCIKIVCSGGKTYYLNFKHEDDTLDAFEDLRFLTGK